MSDSSMSKVIEHAGIVLVACKKIGAGHYGVVFRDTEGAPMATLQATTEPDLALALEAVGDAYDPDRDEDAAALLRRALVDLEDKTADVWPAGNPG